MMDIRDMRIVIAVADEASFTRAAERLMVAQPAVSQRVLRVERVIGCRLFERGRGGVTPTLMGQRILTAIRPLIEHLDRVDRELRRPAILEGGEIVVAALRSLPGVALASLIDALRQRHPGVRVTVRELTTSGMLDQLINGSIDVTICQAPPKLPAVLRVDELARDPFVLIAPPEHPLASRRSVAVAELASEDFVTLPDGSGVRLSLFRAAAQAGFEPRVSVEAEQLSTVREFVSAGLGVALIPRANADAGRPPVHTLAIEAPRPIRRIVLATRADDLRDTTDSFREITLEAFWRSRRGATAIHKG